MPHRWIPLLVGLALVVLTAARSGPTAAAGSAAAGFGAVDPSFGAPAMHLMLILSLLFVVVLGRMGRRRDP